MSGDAFFKSRGTDEEVVGPPPKDPIDPGRAPIEQSGEPPDDPKDTPPAPGRPIDRGGKTGFLGALGEALILAAILMLLAGHIFINALGWGA